MNRIMGIDIQQIVALSELAGAKILEIYADETRFEVVDFKADDSPLTMADKAAHDVIAAGLARLTPDIPVLSEEGKSISYETRRHWDQFWLVDPLDGTKEFIKRNGEFTVNIALISAGRPIMGVVHVPVTGATYYGENGQGAFVKRPDSESVRIEANPVKMDQSGLRLVASRSHMSAEVEAYVKQFASPEIVSMGSSLKFMLIADNEADIYPRLAPTMEWDTGAAQAVLEAAGGSVINHETGQPLSYNKENLLNPHFVAFGRR